jgi:glycosyltransferase involved in cell wall biosynthesis
MMPLRILMITPRYQPDIGGIETHVHEVSKRLSASGHSIVVLTTDRTNTLPATEVSAGVRIRRVRAWPKYRDYYIAPAIHREVLESDCDIIHIQGYHTFVAPLAMLAAIQKRVPFVITFHSGGHSSRWRNLLRRPQWTALRPLVRRAGRCIGVSKFEADFFSAKMQISPQHFTVIPNGAQIPHVDVPMQARNDGPLVVSIGRLERYKGHHRVLSAFPLVLQRVPNARLRILGEGPYRERLISIVRRLGLESHVEIKGIPAADRSGLATVLGSASLVVLLSQYEAHPVSVMEALALRRRVLVTNCSGFREMVERDLVQAVPTNASASRIAEAIAEQLGQNSTLCRVDLPTWESCANRLLEVYESIRYR